MSCTGAQAQVEQSLGDSAGEGPGSAYLRCCTARLCRLRVTSAQASTAPCRSCRSELCTMDSSRGRTAGMNRTTGQARQREGEQVGGECAGQPCPSPTAGRSLGLTHHWGLLLGPLHRGQSKAGSLQARGLGTGPWHAWNMQAGEGIERVQTSTALSLQWDRAQPPPPQEQ